MVFGFGKSHIPYDMFDIERSADEAKRFVKCERIYHRGQEIAWDGKEILPMLLEEHGRINLDDRTKRALERVFAIIMWGELAAWRIAAQLADRLVPLEAKMAATSQAHDEARHFYVMHDYLLQLGYVPERMDRAPQALLNTVLRTDDLAYKLIGMQLLVEPLALTIFQSVRETRVEPVLCDLLRYFERDEARHVGLGMQYLPTLMKHWSRRKLGAMITFQVRMMYWALMELKLLEKDFAVIGIEPREILERARKKQLVVLHSAFEALGVQLGSRRNIASMLMNVVVEFSFPPPESDGRVKTRAQAAWRSLFERLQVVDQDALDVHHTHVIKTARGEMAASEYAAP